MEIKTYPSKLLRVRCKPVLDLTDEDLERARQMLDLMYSSNGVGLAAAQVGWHARVLTLDVEHAGRGDRIFLNPVLVESSGEDEMDEGCLSVPGLFAPVRRAERVVVVTYNIHGERIERTAEGLEARAWQHELDHLNGVLFLDRLDPLKRMALRRELKAMEDECSEKERE